MRFQDIYLENTDDIVEPTFESTFPGIRQEQQQESKDDSRQEANDHQEDQEDVKKVSNPDKESHSVDQTTHGQPEKQSSEEQFKTTSIDEGNQ